MSEKQFKVDHWFILKVSDQQDKGLLLYPGGQCIRESIPILETC